MNTTRVRIEHDGLGLAALLFVALSAACADGSIGDPPVRAPVTVPDAGSSDGGCVGETEAELCARAGYECGPLSVRDGCGVERAVASCGGCTGDDTCGGGGVTGVCGNPVVCTPETDAELCARLGETCGPLSAVDNCGTARTVASCGACPVAATPVFNPPPSTIAAPVNVTITVATPGAVIHYTVDGTLPSPGAGTTHTYSGPVTLQPGTLLQAMATAPDYTSSAIATGWYDRETPRVPVGVNVSWFSTWHEAQPLANVASTGRGFPAALPLDAENQPNADFELMVYEGNMPGGQSSSGGAQTGAHLGRFIGQATLVGQGGTISNASWDQATNVTTFTFTTRQPMSSSIQFTNTRRLPTDAPGNGVRSLEIMRPGHAFGDVVNQAFAQAMRPFSLFRVGPNWTAWTYQTTAPDWSVRAKPGGSFNTTDGDYRGHGAPWETLAAMANALHVDVWVSIPPNADDDYLRNIFRVFVFGSDGVNPYSSPQASPRWRPLDPDRKLYFEMGNEIWNGASPYGDITFQWEDLAAEEYAAGDPYHYGYSHDSPLTVLLLRARYARMIKRASELCREIVGDANMMTRFRPVLAGQSVNMAMGVWSLSYLAAVYGGHDWYRSATPDGSHLRGELLPTLLTPEDGVSINQFGNVARPVSYYIWGYATAPYLHGTNATELRAELDAHVRADMEYNIDLAHRAGVEPMIYEGGIEGFLPYDLDGLDLLVRDMLGHWYDHGGGPFTWFTFAGHKGMGLFPDLTRQDPATWPKMRGMYLVTGLSMSP